MWRTCFLIALPASASALQAATLLHSRRPALAAASQRNAAPVRALLPETAGLPEAASAASTLLADGGVLDGVGGIVAAGVGLVLLIALLAGKGNFGAGAALMVLFLGGDPDKRDESGANDNKLLKEFALSITPSAWKKAYQGAGAEEGEPPELLDLPAWMGDEARALSEPEAVAAVERMQLTQLETPAGPVDTCYISLAPEEPVDAPPVMLIHGFDSSILEFRYITDELTKAGLQVEAMEWCAPLRHPASAPRSSTLLHALIRSSLRTSPPLSSLHSPPLKGTLPTTTPARSGPAHLASVQRSRAHGRPSQVDRRLHGARALHEGDHRRRRRAMGSHPGAPVRVLEAAVRRAEGDAARCELGRRGRARLRGNSSGVRRSSHSDGRRYFVRRDAGNEPIAPLMGVE